MYKQWEKVIKRSCDCELIYSPNIDAKGAYGAYYPKQDKIEIKSDESSSQRVLTFCHEHRHRCCVLDSEDEVQNNAEKDLYYILKTNPDLFSYWHELK